jgi:hypothetical protein
MIVDHQMSSFNISPDAHLEEVPEGWHVGADFVKQGCIENLQ